MKRIASLFLAALSATSLMAQSHKGTFSVIPRVGVTIANVTNEELEFTLASGVSSTQKGKYKAGLTVGADLQYQVNDWLAVSLGAFYARQGYRMSNSELLSTTPGTYSTYEDIHLNLDYINVPLLAHCYVADGLSLNFGIQTGFLIYNRYCYEEGEVVIGRDGSYTYSTARTAYKTHSNYLKTTDITFPVGFSYEYMNVVIDARYNLGLTNIYKGQLNTGQRNRSFMVTVGYKLEL